MRRHVKRDIVVFGIGPEECHLFSAPVGDPETQYVCVKLRHASDVRCVHHNVADRTRLHNCGVLTLRMGDDTG